VDDPSPWGNNLGKSRPIGKNKAQTSGGGDLEGADSYSEET